MEPLRIEIASSSMEPTLPVGCTVECQIGEVVVGDVAAFQVEHQVMVHRIVACWHTRMGTYYVHKGDASTKTGIFRAHQLIGPITGVRVQEPSGFWAQWLWFQGMLARVYAEWRRIAGEIGLTDQQARHLRKQA